MNIQHDTSESIGVEQSSSSVVIHIINHKLDRASSSFPKPTVFKVHTRLRRENETAYEPSIVAIGPYHRGKDRLQVMEDWKLCWLKSILEDLERSDATEYVEAMIRLEPATRQCYSESTQNINKAEFVEMLLLDACFIIQIIRLCLYNTIDKVDPFLQEWSIYSSVRDMLLFENQIPLFVVQELFSMIKKPEEPTHFHELALEFLTTFSEDGLIKIPKSAMRKKLSLSDVSGIQHILGLLHYILRSSAVQDDSAHGPLVNANETNKAKWTIHLRKTAGLKFINKKLQKWDWIDQEDRKIDPDQFVDFIKSESIPTATKLHAAGVEFKSKKVEGGPFEIKFENGVLEVPTFVIDDETESLYRNLIAYEQYNQEGNNRYVCLHAFLMDCLIDSAEDVALLRSSKILVSALGHDEAVSRMFNKLTNQVLVEISEAQAKIFKEVNAYYGKRRHKWMAKLRRDYFNSPWALISFMAAVFLLLLTLIQTVFSILGNV